MAAASAAASSSSSMAAASYPYYHIFINHRGPDVKATFATNLYRRLICNQLQVFLDKPDMLPGHDILSQIEAAIGVAAVHVAIFSPDYASSAWCLDELVLMLQSKDSRAAVILPVFYKVKPSDLRNGTYAEALRVHEEKKRHDLQTIQKWRDALRRVAGISGFELDACNGDEEELLEKIVQTVLKHLPKTPLDVAKYPSGLGEKLQDFHATVLSEEEERLEAKVVGIVGVGGIGKTTLAQQIFNRKSSDYSRSCFLFDLRENAARKSLNVLQTQLVKDLKGKDIQIRRCEEGIGQLKIHLSKCHALVILDDVDRLDQLDVFLPIKDVLHPKSLILVTSRDRGVLRSAGIPKSSIYHLSGLNTLHSQFLFCSHAFSQLYPPPEYQDLVDGFLKACGGLPLSLKVFGALLYGEDDQTYWKEVLNGLHKTLHEDIQQSLMISYNSLNEEEQQIYLDIACFAIGEDRDKWINIWGGSGWKGVAGFKNLKYKCLVEEDMPQIEVFSRNHPGSSFIHGNECIRIRMHDHFRDLGRGIADKMAHSSRLRGVWNFAKKWPGLQSGQPSYGVPEVPEICLFSKSQQGGIVVPGICFTRWLPSNIYPRREVPSIGKLELLAATDSVVERILLWAVSPKLIWLRWIRCPFDSLPDWIPMRDLRVLELSCLRSERLWERESQVPLQLRELNIELLVDADRSFLFPMSIGQLKHLEKIVLKIKLTVKRACCSLILPEEFYDLRSLKYLELDDGDSWRGGRWGIEFSASLGKLTNLEHIHLQSCSDLKSLLNSLGHLSNLQHIDLSRCKCLENLPNSLGNLPNLRYLNLAGCSSLKMLPDSFGNLTNLRYLSLAGCSILKMLPDSFGILRSLRQINLCNCESLEMLPDSFDNLKNLQVVNLFCCNSLKRLSNCSISNVTEQINLQACPSLKSLPDSLGNLTTLHLSDCEGLVKLPNSVGDLLQLKHLHLAGCSSLTISSETLGKITTLECLNLRECCFHMGLLPSEVLNQPLLKKMNSLFTNLKELPSDIARLSNLEVLRLGSPSLEVLPHSFGYLTSLQVLTFYKCKKLQCLPESVGLLTQLTELTIWECGIQKLPPAVMKMKKLNFFTVHNCPLRELPFKKDGGGDPVLLPESDRGKRAQLAQMDSSFEKGMVNLERVHLSRTDIWEVSFPDCVYPNLRELTISCCDDLVEVGAFPVTLKYLELMYCGSLRKIGSLHGFVRLEVEGCPIQVRRVSEVFSEAVEYDVTEVQLDTLDDTWKEKREQQLEDDDGDFEWDCYYGFCDCCWCEKGSVE